MVRPGAVSGRTDRVAARASAGRKIRRKYISDWTLLRKIVSKRTALHMCAVLGSFILVTAADAAYPERYVTLIFPYGTGGPTDTVGRLISLEIEPLLKQKMLVMNKPGASGTIGIADVIRAKPDGYTIGYSTAAIMGLQPLIASLPFKASGDHQPIIKLFDVPIALGVREDSPLRNFHDFLAAVRKNPGALLIAVVGTLTEPDLAVELLKSVAKIDVNNVPFKGGSSEALLATLGGHVESFAAAVTNLKDHVDAKKIRLLAMFSKTRHRLFPAVPSSVELGYEVDLPAMYFIIGPKNMSKEALEVLGAAISNVVAGPRFQDLARKSGFKTDPLGPKGLQAEIDRFAATYARLLAEGKIPKTQ